jgi:hypothetical protein
MIMRQSETPGRQVAAELAAQLLDQVYEAMLRSDYKALPGLEARLTQALQDRTQPMTEAGLGIIRRKAERNAAVLLAAQRGISAARRRLADIRTTRTSLVTYDRSGRRAEVSESRNLAQRL